MFLFKSLFLFVFIADFFIKVHHFMFRHIFNIHLITSVIQK